MTAAAQLRHPRGTIDGDRQDRPARHLTASHGVSWPAQALAAHSGVDVPAPGLEWSTDMVHRVPTGRPWLNEKALQANGF